MKNEKLTAVILAAGKGTRMKSAGAKVLLPLLGKPFLCYVVDALLGVGSALSEIVIVTGYDADAVESCIRNKFDRLFRKDSLVRVRFVRQGKLLGTAHALQKALPLVSNSRLMVLYGDTPLIMTDTLRKLLRRGSKKQISCVLLSALLQEEDVPGALLRDESGAICGILEKAGLRRGGATHRREPFQEANSGIYVFRRTPLRKYLPQIKRNPVKEEYFLTDIISLLYKNGEGVESLRLDDPDETLGINRPAQFAAAEMIMRNRIIVRLQASGVTVLDPATTYIASGVKIGKNTTIYPFTFIEEGAIIGTRCRLGPFIHIRGKTRVYSQTQLGNFLEVNRSNIGKRARIKHFGYIGDADIGDSVNIGAGTVFANYDGKRKRRTIVKKGAFIGSDTVLVAPLRIGEGAYTAAGSVVTRNVKPKTIVAGVPARAMRKRGT